MEVLGAVQQADVSGLGWGRRAGVDLDSGLFSPTQFPFFSAPLGYFLPHKLSFSLETYQAEAPPSIVDSSDVGSALPHLRLWGHLHVSRAKRAHWIQSLDTRVLFMTARMSMLVFPVFAWGVLGDRHKAKCGKGVRSPLTSPAHLTDGIRRKGMTGPLFLIPHRHQGHS